MKFGIKKKFLAAAICLALSTGSAFAMPSGGSVVGGADITGVTSGNLENDATITAATNGVINWESFSIANGETLNFALNNNTLLNRVTGGAESLIYGALNVTDNGNLILSNPNGIVVGADATINAQNLMLTTLSLENDAVNSLFKHDGGIVTLTNKNGTNGVKLEGGKISVDEALSLIGGTVTIADGVTITGVDNPDRNPNPNLMDVNIAAGNTVQVADHDAMFVTATAGTENVVDIKNSNGITSNDIIIFGGKVNVTDTALTSEDALYVKDIFIGAGNSITGDNSGMKVTTTDGNDVTITGSTILNDTYNGTGGGREESHTKIYGSSVTVKDSTVQSNGDIELFAFKSYAYSDNIDNNGEKLDFAASGSKNKLTVDSSTINSNLERATDSSDAVLFGGSVDIAGSSKIEAPANAGHDIFALSSAKVDDATKTFELKANANNKLTIADTVTLTGGNNGPDHNLPGLYAGSIKVGNGEADTTVGEKPKTINGNNVWASIYNNYTPAPNPNPVNPTDISEDTSVEEINKAAENITTSDAAVKVLDSVLNSDLSAEKKQQVVKAVMESSPVMADKNQEIKNQDAASQAASADNAATPVDTGAGVSAGSDNGADSAVSVDGASSDNESEE